MSTFSTRIEVSNIHVHEYRELDALVDTGPHTPYFQRTSFRN